LNELLPHGWLEWIAEHTPVAPWFSTKKNAKVSPIFLFWEDGRLDGWWFRSVKDLILNMGDLTKAGLQQGDG